MQKKIRISLNSILILSFIILINGCSTGLFSKISKNSYAERVFETFQKKEIISNLEVKAIIQSAYLNHTDPEKYSGNEYFFVSVYIADDFQDEEKKGLLNPFYKMSLNGKEAISITPLEKDSELVKKMPFKSNWSSEFVVEFNQSKSEKLTITYEHNHFGKVQLYHLKGSAIEPDYPTIVDRLSN